jgi:4-amino-4-deoxy-L-arabinose transferase-like glycosyltransferase
MPLRRSGTVATLPAWVCRLTATVLILGAAAAHIGYVVRDCPVDLAPDEAHYWDWSRHLDWSYYSKGPLVAWLIRASCDLAGPWAVEHTGTLMPAVRLPAILCGALLLVSLYILTVQVTGRDRLALGLVGLALTVPVISVGSSLMTIDAPYTCCWGWALVLAHRAVFRGSGWAWPLAGLVVGLGILAKYTMVLFLPSLGLFLLTAPEQRRLLPRPGFWVLCAVAVLACFPIMIWNAQHDWVTVKHVLALAGLANAEPKPVDPADAAGIQWLGPLVFIGGQFALMLGYWFVVWAAAMVRHNPLTEENAGLRYLWWMSAPMFGTFLLFGFKTGGGELNWPVTAYLSGSVLGAFWLAGQLNALQPWRRRLSWVLLSTVAALGMTATLFMHYSGSLHSLLERYVVGPSTPNNLFPLRKVDPTCRLRGWRALAAEVDRVRQQLAAEEGVEPVLAAGGWSLAGELGFYCADHPTVYSVGLLNGDRHSQYDLWPGPVTDPGPYLGRTFLVVGGVGAKAAAGFTHCEPTREFYHREGGRPIGCWHLTVCRGFRGFPPPERGAF